MRKASYDVKHSGDRTATIVDHAGMPGHGVLARDLMTELYGVVPILGGRKVTIGFAGHDAFCDADLSYVNIPALPPVNIIPSTIAREIRGFAAHEAAHLAFTDDNLFPAAITDARGQFDKLLKEIWNSVEDFMIEKHWLALYPGAAKNFAATEIRCCRDYLEQYQKNPDIAKDLRKVGPVALTWLRALYLSLGTNVSRECFQTLPGGLQSRVSGWFRDIEDVETTQDCLEAARAIHADILADPFDPADPPQQAAQGQSQQGQSQKAQPQSGQPGQGQSAQGQPGPGQSGQDQSAQGQPGPGQSGQDQSAQGQPGSGPSGQDQSATSGGPGAAAGAPSAHPGNAGPDPIPTSVDLSALLADAGQIDRKADWVTAEILSSAQFGPEAEILSDPKGFHVSDRIAADLRGAISATSSQLRKALKTLSKDRIKGGRLDGKLDLKRLAAVPAGACDIHTRKIRGEALETAVSVLIDTSDSMDGLELKTCQCLAVMLEIALAGTPVRHEILGFTTGDIEEADPAFKTMVQAHEARNTNIEARAINLYEFRGFEQSHTEALRTIGNMTSVRLGGTPTGEAILLAHDRLARRKERRHVLFVLTDGVPDNITECKKAVNAVEKCNVTVVAIGIGTDAVKKAFSHWIVIREASELPALMLSQLSKILIGDKAREALQGRAAQKARAR